MEITTTSTLAPAVPADLQAFYDRQLLERALPLLVHDKFGQVRGIPLHAGRGGHGLSITFRKFGALPINTTPLVEGVAPVGKKLSVTDIKATVEQYGRPCQIAVVKSPLNTKEAYGLFRLSVT